MIESNRNTRVSPHKYYYKECKSKELQNILNYSVIWHKINYNAYEIKDKITSARVREWDLKSSNYRFKRWNPMKNSINIVACDL